MAITEPQLRFVYQDADLDYYELSFDLDTGVGYAIPHGASWKDEPITAGNSYEKTVITVDTDELAAWKTKHYSRRVIGAVYNTDKTLETILNS